MQDTSSENRFEIVPTDWEAAFHESDRRFRLLVDGATNFAMFLIDPDGHIASWNAGAQRILGYDEAEVLGRHASLIFTPEDRAEGIPERELAKARREGRAADVRWHQRKDGTRFWADGIMERLTGATGALEGFAKILRDATEAKQAEDALRDSAAALQVSESRLRDTQSQLEAALSAGDIATCVVDLINNRVFGDSTLPRLFAVSPDVVETWNLDQLLLAIHEDDRERVAQHVADTFASGRNDYEDEYRVAGAAQENDTTAPRWLSARAKIVRDETGAPVRVHGAVINVTARVERERRERFLRELSERAHALGDPETVIAEVVHSLGRYLKVDRCLFADIDLDADTATVHPNYRANDSIVNLIGVLPFSAFGEFVVSEYRAGRATVVDDVQNDPMRVPPATRAAYEAISVGAHIASPAVYSGRPVGVIALHNQTPRHWLPEEVDLVRAVIERTWLAVENARLASALREESEQRREQGERLRFLSELTERARRLTNPETVLDDTLRSVGEFLHLSRYLYADVDEAEESLVVSRNWLDPEQDLTSVEGTWTFETWIREVAPIGVSRAELREGKIGIIRDFETDARTAQEFRNAPEPRTAERVHAVVRVPLYRNGKWVAMLSAQSIAPRDWSADEVTLLETVAERTWLTLENLRLLREALKKEQEQRARAERALVLNKISKAVRGAMNPESILESAITLLGQGLRTDRCYFVRSDAARDTARVSPEWLREDTTLRSLANQTFRVSTYGVNRDEGYRAGRTHVVNDVAVDASEDATALQALQVCSFVRVPINVGSYGTGLTVAMADTPRVWTDGEVRLVENVAALVRAALESVYIQQRERNIAQQLQDALIPSPPTDLPTLSLASFYRPALGEAEVGGDFFDVFEVESGCTALVVADLSGKGLKAASQVAMVRNMLRYALYSAPTLAEAVTGLHRALVKHDLLTGFATLFVGIHDDRAKTLTYVNGGQEPGIIWRMSTGKVELMPPTGPVLGGFGEGDYEEQTVSLSVGDVVALFTDGLTEVGPNRKEQLEVEGVIEVLRNCCVVAAPQTNTPQSVVDCLIGGVDAFARGGARDDIALLVGVVGAKETG